jgi:hypothetical protein
MGFKRLALRAANSILDKAGLSIQGPARDFAATIESPAMLRRMFRQLAEEAAEWLRRQILFDARDFAIEEEVERFYYRYLELPFRETLGCSRFNNLLWLFLLSRAYSPTLIVDSGTFQGGSAWALGMGAPGVPLYSFDVDLSRLIHKVDAHYLQADWSTAALAGDASRGLAYFDDHVDQARRLLEARDRGFGLAIFDDDFALTAFPSQAHGGAALPKVEFVLDEELRRENELCWQESGRRIRWPVDVAYLDRAREAIAATDRLPDTSLITGIQQTPLRVVRLAS